MGVMLGSNDPRRFNDDHENERRWEKVFADSRQRKKETEAQNIENAAFKNALGVLENSVDAITNMTTGSVDRVLTLNGSRGVRGIRERHEADPDDAFVEWETWVAFGLFYSAAPVVVVTAEADDQPVQACIRNVTPYGFYARLFCAAPLLHMRFHFQAWGDA